MPFFLLSEIKPLIPEPLWQKLQENSEARFDQIEPLVNEIIINDGGIENPADIADSPQWVRTPAAWLTTYLADHLTTGKSKEYYDKVLGDYNRALEILKSRRPVISSTATSGLGTIGGLYNGDI
mgnify:CR=1 FL=1